MHIITGIIKMDMMKTNYKLLLFLSFITAFQGCKQTEKPSDEALSFVNVKVTHIRRMDMKKQLEVYGNTIYLNKSMISSPVTGYITDVKMFYGKKVQKNELLFVLETREQKALGTEVSDKRIEIRSNVNGYISSLQHNKPGGFVTEGDLLCIVTDDSRSQIRVTVPFEKAGNISTGNSCKIILPDQSEISGTVSRKIPVIEGKTQTQEILIKPNTTKVLPENLNLIVSFVAFSHNAATVLPKTAVMTNETQSEFWIMKISGDTAYKVPVIKGIEANSLIEITEPELSRNDVIIYEGNYDLPDSSRVNMIQ